MPNPVRSGLSIGMSDVKSNIFDRKKKSIFSSSDSSRKGNIDDAILPLIEFINSLEDYATTSSCSGRIIVLRKGDGESIKKGCKWIFTSHTLVDPNEVVEQLSACKEKNMTLKFEPFILHVNCKDLKAAKKMQDCAFAAGYRDSGTVFGRQSNITLAVRGSLRLEVPLSDDDGALIVSNEYIKYVINMANDKMCQNLKRIEAFTRAVFGITADKDAQQETSCKEDNDNG